MKNILKIQELEREIRRLKATAGNSRETSLYDQLEESKQIARDNITKIEQMAGVVAKQFEQMQQRFEQLRAKSEITSKQKPEMASVATIGNLIEDANYLTSELAKLEQKMRDLNDKASRLVSEYAVTRNEHKTLKAKQDKVKLIIDEKQANILPELEKKLAEIKKLEATVDKALYEKYKSVKKDNIFPVFVKLRDNKCGACQMAQSLNFIQKLKQAGMLPCEECRRIILSDD